MSRPLDDHIGYLLRMAHDRAHRVAAAELPEGPHPRLFGVLATLAATGPISQQRLADRLRINRTMMVKAVDELEQAGLVERRRDPADRRSYALHVTPAGHDMLGPMEADVVRTEARMLEPLAPAERDRLNELLRRLLTAEGRFIPPVLADRAGFLISVAQIGSHERGVILFRPLGIEGRHFGLMTALDEHGPSSQQALAGAMRLSGTMITQMVDDLERGGLVERRRNPADRRSYTVTFTPEGERVLQEARTAIATVDDEITAALGEEGFRELRALLRKLVGI